MKNAPSINQGLGRFFADTYTLCLKTHNFHWNVIGPCSMALHNLFMDQYNKQWLAVDEVAERICTLGFPAPGGYKQFAALTSIRETDEVPSAKDMIRQLLA